MCCCLGGVKRQMTLHAARQLQQQDQQQEAMNSVPVAGELASSKVATALALVRPRENHGAKDCATSVSEAKLPSRL